MPQTPHDALFRAVMSNPKHAASFFGSILPAAVLALLDLATLRHDETSFVDDQLDRSHSDLLFHVQLATGELAFIYLLFEHQSTLCRTMPLRLLRYMVRIWERWQREHPNSDRPPVIIPLVLYHGERPWTLPLRFADSLDCNPEAREALGAYCVDFRYLLFDLSHRSDEELMGSALARTLKLLFKHIPDDDLEAKLPRWKRLFREVIESTGWQSIILVLHYLMTTAAQVPKEKIYRVLYEASTPEAREKIMSAIDEYRLEGEQRGRLLGQRKVVLTQLRFRYGELPEEALRRVQDASEAELSEWSLRVLTAPSLEEVFAD